MDPLRTIWVVVKIGSRVSSGLGFRTSDPQFSDATCGFIGLI